MNRLTPFEFGKNISSRQASVGSFLSKNFPIDFLFLLKVFAISVIIIYGIIYFYNSSSALPNEEIYVPELDSMEGDGIFNENMESSEIYEQENLDTQDENNQLGNSNLISSIKEYFNSDIKESDWFVLDEVRFSGRSAELMVYDQLSYVAGILRNHPDVRITIGGFTDNSGDNEQDLQLSKEMALTVAIKLIELGVNEDEVYYDGFGSSFPICYDESSAKCKSINIRTEIQITR